MNLEKIYHVETLSDIGKINWLLKHNWKLLNTDSTEIIIGADKEVYDKFNLDVFQAEMDGLSSPSKSTANSEKEEWFTEMLGSEKLSEMDSSFLSNSFFNNSFPSNSLFNNSN